MGQQPFRLTPEQLEERRLFAASLLKSGWRPVDVVDECGVTRGAVSRWCKALAQGGVAAKVGLSSSSPGSVPA